MAKKPTITTISSGYASTTALNANFEALKEAFENTLSRDGSTPNSMNADLDMNSNDILNASRILVGGQDYLALSSSYKDAALAAQLAAELAETNAQTSETNAATSAASASSSATSAAASLAAIGTSVSDAAASAAAAATSETNAANSAASASTSSTSASTSASSAATSASQASSSATSAASSASAASTSATAAHTAQAGAEAAYDSFDDRYLGAKASAPTTDNDGDPLLTGALYYNTTAGQLYVWTGSAWDDAAFNASGAVTSFNTRTGAVTLNSTDVANASGLLSTNNLSDLGDAATARTNLGLGTAATTASTDYATAAQGALADTALQNITGESIQNLSDVATMSPTTDQVLSWNGSAWTAADMAGGIAYVRKTANYTASHNEGIIADTSGGAWTLTLPATPSAGDTVIVVDGADWAATNLTVGRNGSTIEGDAEDMTMDIGGSSVQFTYDGTTWQVYAQVGVSGNALVSGDNVSELVNDAGYLTSAPSPFAPTTVSGASQALDLSSYNFFDAGTLTADTTLSFTSVPTEASWTYTAKVQPITTYDIENAFYAGVFKSILSEDNNGWGMFFKPDGTKMYVIGATGDTVHQYSLYTAWDVSKASYDSVSFSVTSQEPAPRGLFFKPDGTKMYVTGTSSDTVYQYSLSTAWDLSTASYDSVSFSVASQETSPSFLFFKPDGTKMYVGGNTGNTVYQYSLSTAWSVSTASYDSVSFNIATEATGLVHASFNPDGTKMYALALSDYSIHQYSLSTAWDVSTASYDSISLTLSDTAPRSFFFKDDGTRLYSLGVLNDQIFQYETYTLPSITLPASVQNSQRVFDPNSRIAYTFFTTDGGTNVYMINQDGSA